MLLDRFLILLFFLYSVWRLCNIQCLFLFVFGMLWLLLSVSVLLPYFTLSQVPPK